MDYNEKTGYIKLYRKTLNNPIVCKDADHFYLWCYLLLNAAYKSYDVIFAKKRITLQPGQLLTGRKSLSKKLGMNESKVERILKELKNEQQIEQQTSNRNRLITVLNWDLYQIIEQQNEQQVNNKRTTSEQQVNTNNNINNINNIKKNKNINNNIVHSANARECFEKLWSLYPKKVGKKKAFDKYMKIRNKVSDEKIEQGIKKYVEYIKSRNIDEKYIKNGLTWFNGEYWDDDYKISGEIEERTETKGNRIWQ